MGNETFLEESYENRVESVIAKAIWTYVSPIIILTGTVTNILAMVILLRKNMRKSTTMFYLTVLAVADTAILYVGLLMYWIRNALGSDPLTVSQLTCKLIKFLIYVLGDFCNWVQVAVTFERYILICFPHKASTFCTKSTAKKNLLGIGIIMCSINFHLFWGYSVQELNGRDVCEESNYFTTYVFTWIDMCMYSLFPFIIICGCNSLIIRQMVLSKRKVIAHNGANTQNSHQKNADMKQRSDITSTLRTINIAFFLLTMPIVVFGLYEPYHPPDSTPYQTSALKLCEAIVTMLGFSNHSIHFFLYILTSRMIRKNLCILIKNSKTYAEGEETASA